MILKNTSGERDTQTCGREQLMVSVSLRPSAVLRVGLVCWTFSPDSLRSSCSFLVFFSSFLYSLSAIFFRFSTKAWPTSTRNTRRFWDTCEEDRLLRSILKCWIENAHLFLCSPRLVNSVVFSSGILIYSSVLWLSSFSSSSFLHPPFWFFWSCQLDCGRKYFTQAPSSSRHS